MTAATTPTASTHGSPVPRIHRWLGAGIVWIGKHVSQLTTRGIIRWAPRTRMSGIDVLCVIPKATQGKIALEKTRDALELLAVYDPQGLERARQLFTAIHLASLFDAFGRYVAQFRLCQLSEPLIVRPNIGPLEIAMVIVHETTHARLDRLGFPYTWENRARIERICDRKSLRFAERVPRSAPAMVKVKERVAQADDAFSPTAYLEHQLRVSQGLKVPKVMHRLNEAVARRHGISLAPRPSAKSPWDQLIERLVQEDAAVGTRVTRYGVSLSDVNGKQMNLAIFGWRPGGKLARVDVGGTAVVSADSVQLKLPDGRCIPLSATIVRRIDRSARKKNKKKGPEWVCGATVGGPGADLTPADLVQFGYAWPESPKASLQGPSAILDT